jgi:hypothetical protein
MFAEYQLPAMCSAALPVGCQPPELMHYVPPVQSSYLAPAGLPAAQEQRCCRGKHTALWQHAMATCEWACSFECKHDVLTGTHRRTQPSKAQLSKFLVGEILDPNDPRNAPLLELLKAQQAGGLHGQPGLFRLDPPADVSFKVTPSDLLLLCGSGTDAPASHLDSGSGISNSASCCGGRLS